MKYLVLVSHGGLAEGVQSSLGMFAGDKTDQVIAVGLKAGKSVDDFALEFRQALAGLAEEDQVVGRYCWGKPSYYCLQCLG